MSDFDAYEYLESTVENPHLEEAKGTAKSAGENGKSEEKSRGRSSKRRSEERDDDSHRSRRAKTDDESRDYDRHREKGSSRHRSRSKDGERDRHRDSREVKEKDGDKERSRGKEDRNGRHRDDERHRDRDRSERDREIEREKDKEKERHRRSSSRSERLRSDHDEKDQERIRDRELKEREKERELRERDRENRRHKDKKEDGVEPVADPERDQRTVFAYQLSLRASEKDVYEFFSRAGKVRDVRLIMDRNTRRSKGVGYVEFYDVMSVPMAIALSGQPLRGQPVMVKPSEAEKNLVQSTSSAAGGSNGQLGSAAARKLYVGNLHVNITESQLREVFEPFGSVELVQLPLDEAGHCKGFGFVQFARLEDARNALNLNGQLEIGNRIIKVSTVTDHAGTQEAAPTTGDLDDDDGGGLSLNSQSRALLMAKLDRSGTATSIAGSIGTPVANGTGLAVPTVPLFGSAPVITSLLPGATGIAGLPGAGLPVGGIPTIDTIGVPSECLLLKNMFDPKLETEPDFDLDIKEDVQEECSKYGKLKHVYVDRDSAGLVYLRFENTQGACEAQRNLHGRWFAGKMITATFMTPQMYENKFPDNGR